jgi:hypothetical protein
MINQECDPAVIVSFVEKIEIEERENAAQPRTFLDLPDKSSYIQKCFEIEFIYFHFISVRVRVRVRVMNCETKNLALILRISHPSHPFAIGCSLSIRRSEDPPDIQQIPALTRFVQNIIEYL